MYCPQCSQEVGDYTRICPACGELLQNTPTNSQNPQAEDNSYQQPEPNYDSYQQPQANDFSYQQPQPNNYNYQQPPNGVIPDYKVQSILLIVFSAVLCCISCLSIVSLAFAIVSLVTSNKIKTHISVGNIDLAMETSKKTKMWCWISFGILMVSLVLAIIFIIAFSSGVYDEVLREFTDLPYDFNYDFDY